MQRTQTVFVRILFLISVWLISFAFGSMVAVDIPDVYTKYLLCSVGCRPKLTLLLLRCLIPICIAWAFRKTNLYIVYAPMIILPAFLSGFIGRMCAVTFGSAGWLIYTMLFFSDIASNTTLLYLLLTFTTKNKSELRKTQFCVSLFLVILICFIDYFVLSKYLSAFIIY